MENNSIEQFAAYLERCKKWEPLMKDLRPLAEEAATAQRGTMEQKKAIRRLNDERRHNIEAMVKKAWPRLRFKVNKRTGWGASYTIYYYDGPQKADFLAAMDLDLFCRTSDEFDGMQDLAYIKKRDFTEFADKYMCIEYGGDIEGKREQSPECQQWMLNQIKKRLSNTPTDLEDYRTTYDYSQKQIAFIAGLWGCNADDLYKKVLQQAPVTVAQLITFGFGLCDFSRRLLWARPKINSLEKNDEQRMNQPPADGLTLEDIADGVVVVGDEPTTKRYWRLIKAHGGNWNKEANQWQATTPEEVQRLREWFGKE